jgi:hypothetical protein
VLVFLSFTVASSVVAPGNGKNKNDDENEPDLLRVDIIHYAKDNAKPEKPDRPGKPPKEPKQESCYELNRVKWKTTPVSYEINPSNGDGLSDEFIMSALTSASETWDNVVSVELFKTPTKNTQIRTTSQDYHNLAYFGGFSDNNIVAQCTYWYYRGGKMQSLVEFDIRFNDYYVWGDNPSVTYGMDLQGIGEHELGHAVGLGDVYSDSCTHVTMYGYADGNGYNKRTLEQPDIDGILELYG